ncbi:MAG: SAM-dependent methyltransferase [Acidobacteriota bacterium]|nr:SAM-dependent methyltransferase [Acidobacteriota bacterium]
MIETISCIPVLAEVLLERIKREGPITFHDWMRDALYDPSHGYYCRDKQTKWGREGDYRTSPERSSLFAATFARYFATIYDELERPSRWTIVEAGAGDGRFAHGVLQTFRVFFPEVLAATRYIIDEISSPSRALAKKRLLPFSRQLEFRNVDDKLDEWEVNPGIIFSNELLDAFPIHRVSMHDGALSEFYVNIGENGEFAWMLGPLSTPLLRSYFQKEGIKLGEGEVAEVNLEMEEWLRRVAARLRRGYLITVDYGLTAAELDGTGTLRGFRRHEIINDVLSRPGEQDLTTTVNWNFVKRVGDQLGFEVWEFARQDRFLLAAGLLDQLQLESQKTESEAEKLRLSTAARDMILPDGMAASFQVLVQKKTSA